VSGEYIQESIPVANLESVCILLALTANYDLGLDAMDISTRNRTSVHSRIRVLIKFTSTHES
jgi:hypothetical protein